MPQLQNLVLTDRKATPVDHTFTPDNIQGNVASVVETTGIPIGNNRVTLSLTRSSTNKYKGSLRFSFPVVQMQTINGVTNPVVVRTSYANLDFTFDQTSTEAERNDVIGMVADALAEGQTLVNDTLVKLQGIY